MTEQIKHSIGLTGGIATGKSTVGKIIAKLGFVVIDADLLAREVVLPHTIGLSKIISTFGNNILSPDGSLNRAKMRELVFTDPQLKKKLEDITHPLIKDLLKTKLQLALPASKYKTWFYEAALLIETNQQAQFKEVWLTNCSVPKQIERLMARNNFTQEEASKIINSQRPFLEKKKIAHYIIETDVSMDILENNIKLKCSNLD
ncbi:dephospho-CoA kinase [Dolichospermum sp. ST_sed1]|nr:dephospho-CoA kinase [Dolichospermum sp. ST_sed1]